MSLPARDTPRPFQPPVAQRDIKAEVIYCVGGVLALLLADYCHHWNRAMPFMFEREGDFTELLIPANLLADDSVLNRAVKVLTAKVCQDVEVIGWMYQFYIEERHDEVLAGFKKNKKAGAAEIPAATQLFTPHWIVRYLVENSLGRLWMLNRPTSHLVDQMEYYIAPVDKETDFLKISRPEELKLIDPACGSGHMLTYAFDLLYAIYEEEGYAPSDISGLILTHNIYGAELDPRAGALAAFALTMKGRVRQRTFFNKQVEPNICILEPIHFTSQELEFLLTTTGDRHAEIAFWNQFEHADKFGSLIQPNHELTARLGRHIAELDDGGDLLTADVIERAEQVLAQAQYLAPRYSVVVTNPPYMGSGNMSGAVSSWIKDAYPDEKQDLYACFIIRSDELVPTGGFIALITGDTWMTNKVFEKLRRRLLAKHAFLSFVHMHDVSNHPDIFGANTAFVLAKDARPDAIGTFVYLDAANSEAKAQHLRKAVRHRDDDRVFLVQSSQFEEVPGAPIVYAASAQERRALASPPRIADLIETREGLTTGDNDRFLRRWYEVSHSRIGVPGLCDSDRSGFLQSRWYIYVKGGEFRRWYGNLEYVVDWEDDGARVKSNIDHLTGRVRSHNYNGEYAFLEGLSWSGISSSRFSVRHVSSGHMFDTKGPMGFSNDRESLLVAIAVLNSSSADRYLGMLAPNLDFKIGHVLSLPVPAEKAVRKKLAERAQEAVGLSENSWNRDELSYEFEGLQFDGHSVVTEWVSNRIAESECIDQRLTVIRNEIDEVIADAEGLNGATGRWRTPDDAVEYQPEALVKEIVSYAVGCMFGRYSLDSPGLVLADQGKTLLEYLGKVPSPSFVPDKDNVIPIVDGDWFEDDIVARFRKFLRAAFGEQHFEENLRFVTESLGVKDLRDYFVKSFYEDHWQRYKKRPIYWLFSSPKGSFNALIYMHRYTPSTVSTVLNEYLREYKAKLESSLQQQERLAAGGGTPGSRQLRRRKRIDSARCCWSSMSTSTTSCTRWRLSSSRSTWTTA